MKKNTEMQAQEDLNEAANKENRTLNIQAHFNNVIAANAERLAK